jgi:hypothetical protein
MKVTARKERETGSGLLRAALSKLIEIPLIWKRKGSQKPADVQHDGDYFMRLSTATSRLARPRPSPYIGKPSGQYKDFTCLILIGR